MADDSSNDNYMSNDPAGPGGPDAHGHAAMLLVESLIHGLIARSIITLADAVEIIGIAAEVKKDIAVDIGDAPENMRRSLALLESVQTSLSIDLPEALA